MPLLLGLTEKRRHVETTTYQFGADDLGNGDSFLMPDTAVYYPLLSCSLQFRELTLIDRLHLRMLPSRKTENGHDTYQLSVVNGHTYISPSAMHMEQPAMGRLATQASRGFVWFSLGPHYMKQRLVPNSINTGLYQR